MCRESEAQTVEVLIIVRDFLESDTVSPELPHSRRHGQDRAWGQ